MTANAQSRAIRFPALEASRREPVCQPSAIVAYEPGPPVGSDEDAVEQRRPSPDC